MGGLLLRSLTPIIAAGVLLLGLVFMSWGLHLLILVVLTVPLVLVGIRDWLQQDWVIASNYPVIGWVRRAGYFLRPFFRAYFVESDLEGTPYNYEARSLIAMRASGQVDTHPFGTELDTAAQEYHWIQHSVVPHATPDRSPRVSVGNAQTAQPYSASVLNISAMSFGALSAKAIEALNKGASRGNFYHDTGEGGVSPYHLAHGGDLVWELGSGYFGARDDKGNFDPALFAEQSSHPAVKMTEIKLSQGAKPGHGGLLPGAKVTAEIAATRKVPAFQDCLSPRGHSAFSTPIELLEFAARMRELSGGKPVGIKLCVGQPHEVFAIMKAMLKTGIHPDFIVVDGKEGGTGAAPLELSDWVGTPLQDGLVLMRNALVGTGLKAHVRLVASGKVFSGMGLAQNLAIGADWCNAARAFMQSIGCIQAQRCHRGTCPTGIATQDKWRQRGLNVDVQSERAARFHARTLEAMSDIVAAAGFAHPEGLQPHHLYQRLDGSTALPLDRIIPFLPENVLLESPQETLYAHWWAIAQAESFEPAEDPMARRSSIAIEQMTTTC